MLAISATRFESLNVFDFIQLDAFSKMFFEGRWKIANHGHEKLFFGLAGIREEAINLHRQISRVVDERAPQLSAFPPTIVSCVGSKNDQQRKYETENGMHDGGISQHLLHGFTGLTHSHIAKKMNFKRRHKSCIGRNNEHLKQKDPEGIRFVKVEDVSKPDFVVVFNHRLYKCETTIETELQRTLKNNVYIVQPFMRDPIAQKFMGSPEGLHPCIVEQQGCLL